MMNGSLRRAAVEKNVIMVGVAVVLLLVAVVVLVRFSGPEEVVLDDQVRSQPVPVSCSQCGHTWEVTLEEYQELAREAVAAGTKIQCPNCKAGAGWSQPTLSQMPTPRQEDMDAAVDFLSGANTEDTYGSDYDYGTGDSGQAEDPKKKAKARAGIARRPS